MKRDANSLTAHSPQSFYSNLFPISHTFNESVKSFVARKQEFATDIAAYRQFLLPSDDL